MLKKEFITHSVFLLAFFILISVYKTFRLAPAVSWFTLSHIPFWIGGVVGSLLVYSDHFIYALFLRPHEESSRQASLLVQEKKIREASSLLINNHASNDNLIFHNAGVLSLFLVFSFFVMTSSGSLLGRGLVLGFVLHLLVDMTSDLAQRRSIKRWFRKFPLILDEKQQRWYLGIHVLILLLLGFVF